MKEIWAVLPKDPDYEASTKGRVRRKVNGVYTDVDVYLIKGVPTFKVIRPGRDNAEKRLDNTVLNLFGDYNPKKNLKIAVHLNGDLKDCRIDNLLWTVRDEQKPNRITKKLEEDEQKKWTVPSLFGFAYNVCMLGNEGYVTYSVRFKKKIGTFSNEESRTLDRKGHFYMKRMTQILCDEGTIDGKLCIWETSPSGFTNAEFFFGLKDDGTVEEVCSCLDEHINFICNNFDVYVK